jgi:hypothetical protein
MRVTIATLNQSFKKRAAFLAIGVFLLFAEQPGLGQAPPPDALKFFKNYFVTGDYVSAGVNLRGTGSGGFATGEIHFAGAETVPANADILAAFLYWEAVVKQDQPTSGYVGAQFRGNLLQTGNLEVAATATTTLAYELNPFGTAPCWSSGGGAGSANGAHKMKAYRADVLRFLPIGNDSTKPGYGKRLVNDSDLSAHGYGPHTVTMPEPGSGNQVPSTAGASLVVIYKDIRDDLDPTIAGLQRPPLRSIVIYNGGWTMDQNTDFMSQKIKGFYQSSGDPDAKMTHIVGDGQANFSEQVLFKGPEPAQFGVIAPAPGPFQGAASTSVDPAWDNWTHYFGAGEFPAGAGEVTVRVDHGNFTPFDCLSWGAIILSTAVQDGDEDGIVDTWETSRTDPLLPLDPNGYVDPNGQALPDLYAMGAQPGQKDLFVEFGYASAAAQTTYGIDPNTRVTTAAHNHRPTAAALKAVGDAFARQGIWVHFDAGDAYPGGTDAEPYLIRDENGLDLARGGEWIAETACVPYDHDRNASTPKVPCLFSGYPGTWGWKSGFRFLRDKPLTLTIGSASPILNPTEQACVAAENDTDVPEVTTCVRRFDRNRKDIFRYTLWGHALGLPRLDGSGHRLIDPPGAQDPDPVDAAPPALPMCDATHVPPNCVGSYIPRNVSGTADGGGSGGGDLLISLGPFGANEGNGGSHAEAATFMHELGHTLRLRHGAVLDGGIAKLEPNCKPNYQSVMNYLYQLRGLIVDSGAQAGLPAVDYSGQVLGVAGVANSPLEEGSLNEAAGLSGSTPMSYRARWFTPGGVASNLSSPITRHCDGTARTPDEITQDVRMFTVDGTSTTGPIDWDADGVIDALPVPQQDINFDGGPNTAVGTSTDGPFHGFNDWAYIDLRQVGSRRNVASPVGAEVEGPLSLDQGVGDNGVGDNGVGDNGVGDNGVGDNGVGDNGVGDNGVGDNGVGDNGVGDNGAPADEIDVATALATGAGAPNGLGAALTGTRRDVRVSWSQATLSKVFGTATYEVYRVAGVPANLANATRVGTVVGTGGNPPDTTFVDVNPKGKTTYTYFVIAVSGHAVPVRSPRSNLAVIFVP